MFLHGLGPDPPVNDAQTYALVGCPDILEADYGSPSIRRVLKQRPGAFEN